MALHACRTEDFVLPVRVYQSFFTSQVWQDFNGNNCIIIIACILQTDGIAVLDFKRQRILILRYELTVDGLHLVGIRIVACIVHQIGILVGIQHVYLL